LELNDLGSKFEKVQVDKDRASETKEREIHSLKGSIRTLEGEISKLREEAAQDRVLASQHNPVVDMNESSITHSHLVHKGGMSPPLDEEDSVEIDLNAIGLPP